MYVVTNFLGLTSLYTLQYRESAFKNQASRNNFLKNANKYLSCRTVDKQGKSRNNPTAQ